jgi:hypothetical protein
MNNNSSSPAIRSNMPDLLPQTPSGGPPTPVSRSGGGGHEGHGGGGGPQGSPLTGLQVLALVDNFFRSACSVFTHGFSRNWTDILLLNVCRTFYWTLL